MQDAMNKAEQRRNLDNMKKKLGIIETLKAAKTVKQVNELAKKLETYDQVSAKTVRKFTKVSKKKIAQIKKKNGSEALSATLRGRKN
jgi:hypothetical protein